MFQFGIFAALLLLIALCFVLIPLLTARELPQSAEDLLNVQLAQKKLRELDEDLADGNLTLEQYDVAKEELEVNLYHDLQADVALNADPDKGRWLAIPLLFFVPLIALAIYSIIGNTNAFDPNIAKAQEPAAMAENGAPAPANKAEQSAQINAMVEKLAARLVKEPKDSKGWLMLGHSYKVLQRYQDSVDALRKAYALLGDQPEVLLQLADGLAMANDGTLKGEATQLIEKAIALKPDNEMGLWLYGMAKAEAGDFNAAVTYWTKLQQHYKPDERAYQEVQQLLDQANAKLGKAPAARAAAPEPATEKAVSDLSGSVNVKVELGDAFKGKANPEDFVFIYAQALVGPKAPLAVVKKQVKDLPISVVLDDSMAMIPGMNVSSMENIKITARISATGTATAQPGEAFGAIEIMGMNRSGVKAIVINDTIK